MMKRKETPMFSILVPIYQVEAYLPACVESIQNQSFEDFEIILIDDGSRDRCPAICDAYAAKDDRIHVIHKSNGGLVSARKAGIQQAKGTYVLNLDGDDCLEPDFLGQLAKVLREFQPDAAAFECVQKYSDGTETILPNGLPEGLYTGEQLRQIWNTLLCSRSDRHMNFGCLLPSICLKAVRRELLLPNQLAVPNAITNGEDTAVTMPTLCAARSILVSKLHGYCYLQHESSMIHTYRRDEMGKYRLLREYLNSRALQIPRENQDAYFFNLVVNHISQAAAAVDSFREFRTYVRDTVMANLGDVIRSCTPWPMEPKLKIRFFLIRHQWLLPLWAYYRKGK